MWNLVQKESKGAIKETVSPNSIPLHSVSESKAQDNEANEKVIITKEWIAVCLV